ncbi:MAG TPA: 50S ribosomal protein L15 [Candidatus Altiarchaeales archaeon]|nr:50S ribosomal protein L15 [Candidatus Altiarchaeales archaeon]
MAHKDRKIHKHRGHRNQGYGCSKKHRGKGSKGGKGNAGSKSHKRIYFSKYEPDHFGRRGFKRPFATRKVKRVINLSYLEENFDSLLKENKIEKRGDKFYINLKDLGYDKLLGAGMLSKPMIIGVESCSEKAKEKVENAGGVIELI